MLHELLLGYIYTSEHIKNLRPTALQTDVRARCRHWRFPAQYSWDVMTARAASCFESDLESRTDLIKWRGTAYTPNVTYQYHQDNQYSYKIQTICDLKKNMLNQLIRFLQFHLPCIMFILLGNKLVDWLIDWLIDLYLFFCVKRDWRYLRETWSVIYIPRDPWLRHLFPREKNDQIGQNSLI